MWMWDKFTKLLPPWAQITVVISGLVGAWGPALQWLQKATSAVPPGVLRGALEALPFALLTAVLLRYMRRCGDLAGRLEQLKPELGEVGERVKVVRADIKKLRDNDAVLKGHIDAAQVIIASLVSVLEGDVTRLGGRLYEGVKEHIANWWLRGGFADTPADVAAARDAVLREFLRALEERGGVEEGGENGERES